MTHPEKSALTTLPKDRDVVLRVIPMPSDSNIHGDVFGGWIMSQVDIAGSIPAARRAAGRRAQALGGKPNARAHLCAHGVGLFYG